MDAEMSGSLFGKTARDSSTATQTETETANRLVMWLCVSWHIWTDVDIQAGCPYVKPISRHSTSWHWQSVLGILYLRYHHYFCLWFLLVVSAEEHSSASDATAIEWRCRLLGQGRIVISADVVIFRGISFSLAVSWRGDSGVSTMQNPVPIANRYRLQPVATDS